MNKDQFLGLARELLTAIGGALIAYGLTTGAIWDDITGIILSIGMLVSSVRNRGGAEIAKSLTRKILSLLGGLAVGFGWVAPEKADALIGVLFNLTSLVWTYLDKGGQVPPVAPLIAFLALLLNSCAGGFRFTPDGCLLASFRREQQTIYTGPCVNEKGEVDRVVVQWDNEDGQTLQATIFGDRRRFLLEYEVGTAFVIWSPESGVKLGQIPPEVVQVMDVVPVDAVVAEPPTAARR